LFGYAFWLALRPQPFLPRGRLFMRDIKRRCRKLRKRWTRSATIALSAALLTGCVTESFSALTAAGSLGGAYLSYLSSEKGEPVIVTPPIVDYADAVQDLAADELERLGPPCARDVVLADCSALARFVTDYGVLRDKIRAAKE